MKKSTEQVNAVMLALYRQGIYTHKEIAAMVEKSYQCAIHFYRTHKESFQLPPPPRKYGEGPKWQGYNLAQMHAYYMSGKTLQEVGEAFGNLTRERIRQIFEKNNLPKHSPIRKRRFNTCTKGHQLQEGEARNKCTTCKALVIKKKLDRLVVCKNGHAMIGHNIYIARSKGKIQGLRCRTCMYSSIRKHHQKLKE